MNSFPFAARAALAAVVLVWLPHEALAQAPAPPPQGVLMLSASASVEVPKDWLQIVFAIQREGVDAAHVQAQLKQALDLALTEARRVARAGQIEVQTGTFSLNPRYAPKGGMNGWQGRAELLVEGRDATGLAQLAGRIQGLSIARVGWGLSREARERVEGEVSAQAIARFRARADSHARQFGYSGYVIREAHVAASEPPGGGPVPMAHARLASAPAEEELPVEAGKASVTVTVSGSVQMK